MKILVTGATGFIGSHVAEQLHVAGHQVRCTIRKSSNLRWLADKGFELIETDFNDTASLKKAVAGMDYIYHIAGATFAKNEAAFMQSNRDATKNICAVAMKECPQLKRFLFVSSQTVAGPAMALDKPVTEDMLANPLTAYARSKKAAEDEVLKYATQMPITICRAPAVYGQRDTAILDIFKIVNKGFGTLIGFNKKYISLIHGQDLARGLILAGESDNTIGETYFMGSSEFYSWDKLIGTMSESFGRKHILKIRLPHFMVLMAGKLVESFGHVFNMTPVFNYEKAIDFIQQYWICSAKKAERDFGFVQKISLEDGMKKTIDWYKQNNWL